MATRKRKNPSRPHIHEKPTPKNKLIDNNSAKDQGGTVRDWPNELGGIVRSPLLGEGYYSDPSGLPGGGLSVSEWRKKKKKKRKQHAERAKKIMATYMLAQMYLKIAKQIDNSILSWINDNLPDLVLKYIVESKELKKCGTLSQKIVDKAKKDGIDAELIDNLGHVVVHLGSGKNKYSVDATYLQFDFPYHGSLRDFTIDERDSDEYIKMKNLFDELAIDPMKAVKIDHIGIK